MRIPRIAVTALSAGITVSTVCAQIPLACNLTPLLQVSQESTKLTIRVVDTSGAAIPKAEVTLINQLEDHVQIKQTTNQEGQASFLVIPTGHYIISVTAQGFRTNELAIAMASKPFELTVPLQIKSGSNADIVPLSEGQESTTLAILVVDQQGAVIATARVTLMGQENHIQAKLTSNQEGKVSFLAVPAGPYRISVSAPGFKTSEQLVGIERQPVAIKIVLPVGTYSGPDTSFQPIPVDETITTPEIAPYPIQPLPADSKKKDKKKSR